MTLTPLEMAVFEKLCEQLPEQDRIALEKQIRGMKVLARENTGAGFFTRFELAESNSGPIKADVKSYCVTAKINDVTDALAFILWLKDGYVDYLEGYTLALRDTKDLSLTSLEFEVYYGFRTP